MCGNSTSVRTECLGVSVYVRVHACTHGVVWRADGFHKVVSPTHGPHDAGQLEFAHPLVHRGRPADLTLVKRSAGTKKVRVSGSS